MSISALGRSHCPCIAIRWGRTYRCCLQHGRTGSSAFGSAEAAAWEPEGQEVPLPPPARNIWFAEQENQEREAPAQTRATSKRIGLIGRRPQKLILRQLQHSQFQGVSY